jgi:hypothetical protein
MRISVSESNAAVVAHAQRSTTVCGDSGTFAAHDNTLIRSLQIALALLATPRLFINLILVPLLLSLAIVGIQTLASIAVYQALEIRDVGTDAQLQTYSSSFAPYILGDEVIPDKPTICRWVFDEQGVEVPQSNDCMPDRLDIALQVTDPQHFNPTKYETLFSGVTHRLHLCISCTPDLVISLRDPEPMVEVRSMWAGLLLHLATVQSLSRDAAASKAQRAVDLSHILGSIELKLPGLQHSVKLSKLKAPLILVFNIGTLTVVALWLALKAHKKVLYYFAQNGALLPMVAATGQGAFYGALWMITLARVLAFLLAAIPLTLWAIYELALTSESIELITRNPMMTIGWLLALVSSFTLATCIASIADLKHRTHVFAIRYQILPLLFATLGAFVWSFTFLFESNLILSVRTVIGALPIFGMVPVFLGLIIQSTAWALYFHTVTSGLLIVALLRSNAEWFGAHLEEV